MKKHEFTERKKEIMPYSEKIRKCIQTQFDKDEWYYTFDEEEGVFRTKIKLNGRLNRCELFVRIHEDYYVAYSGISINADEQSMPLVAEYLHRANYGLKMGSFELDHSDGEIRFKVFVDCGDNGVHLSVALAQQKVFQGGV